MNHQRTHYYYPDNNFQCYYCNKILPIRTLPPDDHYIQGHYCDFCRTNYYWTFNRHNHKVLDFELHEIQIHIKPEIYLYLFINNSPAKLKHQSYHTNNTIAAFNDSFSLLTLNKEQLVKKISKILPFI